MKMKKLILTVVCFLLVLSMTMTACNRNSEISDTSPSPGDTVNPSETAPELTEDLSKYGIVLNKLLIREQEPEQYPYIQDWQDLIHEKYNIDMKINFVNTGYQYFTDYYLQNRKELNLIGIVYLSDFRGYNDLKKLIDKDALMPLTDLLKDNVLFSKMPLEFQEMYRLNDGEIWAIPAEIRYNGFVTRITRTDWLEAVGLEAPTTYAELYEMAKRFTTKDPDNDGRANTYGLNTIDDKSFNGLQDLFFANGVYLAEDSRYTTGYNPTSGTYEDAMLNPNMLEVLTFIRTLVNEELLDHYGPLSGKTYGYIKPHSGSVSGYASDALLNETISTIRESQQEAVSKIDYATSAYVMMENTVNAKEMLNSFINTFMGDMQAHQMLRFGMPGISYDVEGQNLILHDKFRDNLDLLPRKWVENESPEIVDAPSQYPLYATQMTPIFYDAPYFVFYNEYDKSTADYQEKAIVDTKAYFDQNPSFFYTIPNLAKGFVTNFSTNMEMFSEDVAMKIYANEISVDEIISEYKRNAKYFDVLGQLEKINAELGLQTVYGYDD